MLSHDQPATTPAVRRRPAGRVRIVLLTADIGYALLYGLGHDLVAALLRPDYSPIGLAASGPSWLPFPMSARGDIAGSGGGLTDFMHVVLLHGARRRSDVDGPGR